MMAESREDISGLVEALVLPLVDEPDAGIESSDTEMGSVLIEVRVAQADAGKVIGRQGSRYQSNPHACSRCGFRPWSRC